MNPLITVCVCQTYTMQHPEGLHEIKEKLVKELKAKLTVPPDVRALLFLSVPKCGEIKLRSFATELLLVFLILAIGLLKSTIFLRNIKYNIH